MPTQSHSEVIAAPIADCFEALTDFARYPEWFSGITAAEVLESSPESCRWTVRFELSMVVKTISYTLAYEGERPEKLVWELVEGDVSAVEGSYELESLEPDVTEATCSQSIDVGFWIPGPIKRTFEQTALVDSVREFKAAVEA